MLEGSAVPKVRVRAVNDGSIREDGAYVLYWMVANRRYDYNYSLERAVEWAKELGKPLLILEALRVGYRWASDRLHAFVIQGMRDNAARLESRAVTYYPYLERSEGEGKGLLAALAEKACVVVTDDFPAFFLPRMISSAGKRLAVRLEAIDGNGLLPMRATDKVYARAHDFRRHLQRTMPDAIYEYPKQDPLRALELPTLAVPKTILERWPAASTEELEDPPLASLPIDHDVGVVDLEGGGVAGRARARDFLDERLAGYAEGRNHPDEDAASGLSPYLHFGHVSAHAVVRELANRESWEPDVLEPSSAGKREGWWKMSTPAEAFLDELITWREVGFNMCALRPDDYDAYESLPDWVQKNFDAHAGDPREHVYTLEQFERAKTHDEIWNAAQRELVTTGRMHNYLRMLWGKKILEWTCSPRDALDVMIELNNKYALDGRNPNSYSGIFWCLGRYDRAWGPERPIFGKVRFMSSDSTRRKLRLSPYLEKYGESAQLSLS
ncbi:MAG: deoxyribodipyrimidine photolyase [Nannocystaceae bacterium]|nr:deoxyribodipyrimidine photolyase [bacterium]